MLRDVHRVRMLAGDRLYRDHALMARLVCEERRRGDVADRIEAGDIGLAGRVGDDVAALGLHAQRLEPDILGVRHDADRDDDMAELLDGDLAVLVLDRRLHARTGDFQLVDAGRGQDRHPLLLERLLQMRGDVLVLHRHHAIEHLDDGHVRAHVVVEAGELHADRTRSDDQQPGRHLGRRHRRPVRPDPLAVGLGEGQVAGAGAGGDDDVLRLDIGLLAVLARHGQLARRGQYAGAHVHGDLVLLHQVRDALIELLRHAARALHHGLQVGADLVGDQPVILGVLHVVEDLGRAEQRLGRDAAPVEADAAQQLALDDRRLETQLRGADRRHIAAGARAEHDHVIGISQGRSPSFDMMRIWGVSPWLHRAGAAACARRPRRTRTAPASRGSFPRNAGRGARTGRRSSSRCARP
jgi:hypothetical protein